jgi:hypothetical protein
LGTGAPIDLVPGDLTFDDCGRFAAIDIDEPASGVLAILVGDSVAVNQHVPSFAVFPAPEGTRRNDLLVYSVRAEADVWWTATAGNPFGGESFSQRGGHLLLLQHGEDPVAGVTVGNGELFYFGDDDPELRSSIDPDATATGVNGAALRVDSSIGATATGAETSGCVWDPLPFGTVPGHVWVETVLLEDAVNQDTCP